MTAVCTTPRMTEYLAPAERKRLTTPLGVPDDAIGETRDYGLESVD